eukprot:1071097-Pleurochrysis_carterae.AAC.2
MAWFFDSSSMREARSACTGPRARRVLSRRATSRWRKHRKGVSMQHAAARVTASANNATVPSTYEGNVKRARWSR